MQRLLDVLMLLFRSALGPLDGTPTITNSAALGTTPVKVLAAAASPTGKTRRCKLVLVSSTGNIGWKHLPTTATAPTAGTMTAAGAGAATDAILILQEQKFEYLNVKDDRDLWVVGSTTLTYQLSYVEQ